MALAANALTTVAALETELGITPASETTYCETLINRASQAIERYCNRIFYQTAGIVELVPGYGGNRLIVSRAPVTALTAVAFNGSALTLADFEIHEAEAGVIRCVKPLLWSTVVLPNIERDAYPGEERKLYSVTYTGGYATIPVDVEEACLIAAVDRYRRRGQAASVKSERLLSYSVAYHDDEASIESGLPPSARGLLAPFVRPALA